MANYYYKNSTTNPHNSCLPHSFRLLIVGSSGSGKTTLLMKLLLEKNLINYNKLCIFAKSLYQSEYTVIQAGFENKLSKNYMLKKLNSGDEIRDENYWKNKINDDKDDILTIESVAAAMTILQKKPSTLEGEFHTSADAIPDPADLNKSIRNLMIFDDIMTEHNQDAAANYFNVVEVQIVTVYIYLNITLNYHYTLSDLIVTL